MTTGQRPQAVPVARVRADQRRRIALLLETADVLAERARRTADAAQAEVLLRRSAQRRAQAVRLAAGPPRPLPVRARAAGPEHLAERR